MREKDGRTFGFVRFTDLNDQREALIHMNGFNGLGGKPIKVGFQIRLGRCLKPLQVRLVIIVTCVVEHCILFPMVVSSELTGSYFSSLHNFYFFINPFNLFPFCFAWRTTFIFKIDVNGKKMFRWLKKSGRA